ncbi:hypothetical protein QAO71_17970 (plasmid) [Halopseudomonas sp. SMJS2]|uniref:hypothetical protein n=1 Tax=Halopseudomonas sp. SMJS2 TaxID=3041098 RepID=UPI0024536856|nr:hypothetical protein [Halopseudomonas sp. SMJS2]WGK63429.1 hypothetical protein QAO71_17970 [Halopseudomonas sp. SMJS2]
MSESSRIKEMLRSPKAMLQFQLTGQLPSLPPREKPSPLAALLLSLSQRELLLVRNLMVGPDLGYQGQRTFANGAQALNWVYTKHASQHTPADSWRNRRFEQLSKPISLEQLLKQCSPPPPLDQFRKR